MFYNLVLFAVLLVAASILIGQLTAGQDVKIIKDLGLAATSLFGLFIAIFVGINLVSKEVDRRSVYPLFAKPIRRSEFILGKYAGLLLTLLANMAVMTIAIYAVLFFLSRGVPPNIQAAWDAPAMDPALLKAIALIYLNLAVVTAVALFFSTYSSPMLSAVFTLGVYVAGQFNADLKRFDLIRRFARGRRPGEGLLLRPAGLREVRRQARRRPRHSRQRRLPGVDGRLRGDVHRRAPLRRGDDLLEEGLQVTPSTSLGAGRAAAAAAVCLAGAVALHAAQDRWPAPVVDRPGLMYLRSPAVVKRIVLDYDAIAADLYWIRALQHFGEERLSPPEHVRTYALLYPLLDLTTTLDPYFSIAYRFGAIFLGEAYPGGPGRPDLAVALLQKGLAAQPGKWQYMMDLGFVYYWHLRDYKSAAATFQRASELPGAPSWLRPLAAVTLAEGGHRDASRALWQQLAQADEPWLRDSAGVAARAARRHGRHRVAAGARAGVPRRASGRAGDVGAAGRGQAPAGHPARFLRHPVRARSRDRRDHRGARVEALSPSRPDPGAPRDAVSARFRGGHARAVRALRRQLPQRLHPSAAARGIDRPPGVAVPRLRPALAWWDNIPVLSYVALRGRCRTCRLPISMRYPIVEVLTAAIFLAHWYVFGPTPLLFVRLVFACALIVLFAIDLEHQILPNVITLPGIVVGFVCSVFLPPGPVMSLAGIALGGGLLWGIAEGWFRLRKVEAMGFGDVKMLAMVGAFLGVKLVILTFVLSSLIGGVVAAVLVATRRADMATKVPFGTMLAVAALVASVFGDALVSWYLSNL